ncbi:MAG TPA: hypothetical protein VGF33_07390, partial [Caulobacteraceae bacterium]
MTLRGALSIAATLFALGACAQVSMAPIPDRAAPPISDSLTTLPGWEVEDHVAALRAVEAACATSHEPSLRDVCGAA